MAMAAAPAITQFVGGTPQMALQTTLEMYEITFGEHENLTIPALNFRGTPLGIDVRKVMETGILPQINTGIAHKTLAWAWSVRASYAPRTMFQGCIHSLAANVMAGTGSAVFARHVHSFLRKSNHKEPI